MAWPWFYVKTLRRSTAKACRSTANGLAISDASVTFSSRWRAWMVERREANHRCEIHSSLLTIRAKLNEKRSRDNDGNNTIRRWREKGKKFRSFSRSLGIALSHRFRNFLPQLLFVCSHCQRNLLRQMWLIFLCFIYLSHTDFYSYYY